MVIEGAGVASHRDRLRAVSADDPEEERRGVASHLDDWTVGVASHFWEDIMGVASDAVEDPEANMGVSSHRLRLLGAKD